MVAEMLQGHAATSGVDLVVMATHGHGPLSRLWLGSVADEMVRRATTPILLVRPHEGELDLTSELELHRILVPLDGSALAEHILDPAKTLAGVMHAELSLLQVYGSRVDVVPATTAVRDAAEAGIAQLRLRAETSQML